MSIEKIIKDSIKRQEAISAAKEAEQQKKQKDEAEERKRLLDNDQAINKQLNWLLNRYFDRFFSEVKTAGYDINHYNASNAGFGELTIYMKRGSLVHMLGSEGDRFVADHKLVFAGNRVTGIITAEYIHVPTGKGALFARIKPNDYLNETKADEIFEAFVKESTQMDEKMSERD